MTNAQLKANRENAQLGGVKTAEGKQVSRLNALKYGFFSRIVTEYDKLADADLCQDIYACFNPQTAYESQLVEILLTNLLAYRRISFVEHEHIEQRLNPRIPFIADIPEPTVQEEYRPRIKSDVVDELEKFQRYKTVTVNLMLKTQHELERLQRLRGGEFVPSPVAVDVNVSTE